MECPNCGNEVIEDEKYCSECGKALKEESIKETGEKGLEYRAKTYKKGAPLMGANIAVYFLGVLVLLMAPLNNIEVGLMFLLSILPLIPLNIYLYFRYLS